MAKGHKAKKTAKKRMAKATRRVTKKKRSVVERVPAISPELEDVVNTPREQTQATGEQMAAAEAPMPEDDVPW